MRFLVPFSLILALVSGQKCKEQNLHRCAELMTVVPADAECDCFNFCRGKFAGCVQEFSADENCHLFGSVVTGCTRAHDPLSHEDGKTRSYVTSRSLKATDGTEIGDVTVKFEMNEPSSSNPNDDSFTYTVSLPDGSTTTGQGRANRRSLDNGLFQPEIDVVIVNSEGSETFSTSNGRTGASGETTTELEVVEVTITQGPGGGGGGGTTGDGADVTEPGSQQGEWLVTVTINGQKTTTTAQGGDGGRGGAGANIGTGANGQKCGFNNNCVDLTGNNRDGGGGNAGGSGSRSSKGDKTRGGGPAGIEEAAEGSSAFHSMAGHSWSAVMAAAIVFWLW